MKLHLKAEIHVFYIGKGLEYLQEHPELANKISLANCSFHSPATRVKEAEDLPITLVCASGNDGCDDLVNTPANLDWTIAVGALQASNDRAASYSNCGEELDCMGYTNIYVYDEKGRETMFTGTSCATPFVVGMLAVYMSKVGKKSREKLKTIY